jgi:hypothetical protein
MVCFRYVSVNILHKGDGDDDNNNNEHGIGKICRGKETAL